MKQVGSQHWVFEHSCGCQHAISAIAAASSESGLLDEPQPIPSEAENTQSTISLTICRNANRISKGYHGAIAVRGEYRAQSRVRDTVIAITSGGSLSSAVNCAGGAGGVKQGTGVNGSAGSAGNLILISPG